MEEIIITAGTVEDPAEDMLDTDGFEPLSEDPEEKKRIGNARKANGIRVAATVFGIASTAITVIRAMLLPILIILGLIIIFAFWFFAMMGGMIIFAMATIVLPIIIIPVLLVGVLILALIALAELTPIIIGALALILAMISFIFEKKAAGSEICSVKIKALSLIFGIGGFVLPLLLAPVLLIPTLIMLSPAIFMVIIALVFTVQIFTLA